MSTTTDTARAAGLRFVDADGHVLEHPDAMLEYAPTEYRDRIWHIETDRAGDEWLVFDGDRKSANTYALSGTAGMAIEDRARAQRGELRYSEVRPAAYHARARVDDMTLDSIDQAVLYPTALLGIAGVRDAEFAAVQCRAYNDWLSDFVGEVPDRLFGVAIMPQQNIDHTVTEIRRVASKPGIVAIMLRPNPTDDWNPMNDEAYDPIWRAACDVGLPIGFHPFPAADVPGACMGYQVNSRTAPSAIPSARGSTLTNLLFAHSISNPFDMMYTLTFVTMGGVCERFPDQKFAFLEANGGWIVTWLERLDHKYRYFSWGAPYLRDEPSAYFRRQCWISFDPDESTLAFSASSPMVGADRIVWASDYPHPDAEFPGITKDLSDAMAALTHEQQRAVAGGSCRSLYGI